MVEKATTAAAALSFSYSEKAHWSGRIAAVAVAFRT